MTSLVNRNQILALLLSIALPTVSGIGPDGGPGDGGDGDDGLPTGDKKRVRDGVDPVEGDFQSAVSAEGLFPMVVNAVQIN